MKVSFLIALIVALPLALGACAMTGQTSGPGQTQQPVEVPRDMSGQTHDEREWRRFVAQVNALNDAQREEAAAQAGLVFERVPEPLNGLKYAYLLILASPDEAALAHAAALLQRIPDSSHYAAYRTLLLQHIKLVQQQQVDAARLRQLASRQRVLERDRQALQEQLESLKDIETRMIEGQQIPDVSAPDGPEANDPDSDGAARSGPDPDGAEQEQPRGNRDPAGAFSARHDERSQGERRVL
jgi:hypothetical protein